MPRVRQELARAENAIVESNSILRFLQPDLYVSVIDSGIADFKESARHYLDRADAVLAPEGALLDVSPVLVRRAKIFSMRAPVYCEPDFVEFVRQRLGVLTRKAPPPPLFSSNYSKQKV
jgi:hypothetical protein